PQGPHNANSTSIEHVLLVLQNAQTDESGLPNISSLEVHAFIIVSSFNKPAVENPSTPLPVHFLINFLQPL
ncbi:hypothetical protein, partial [Pseudomonas viridiflava]|uniref:hypothetical protein n=1 Tax=Pseudomonas viridiflava TaxID=33069 RepID=UPI00197D7D28